MIRIVPFFAVPFGMAKMENCASLNAELAELFRERASHGTKYANPRPLTQRNPQVFESSFDLFRWPEPCIQKLKEYCWANLMYFIRTLNQYDDAMMRRILIYSDSWFHLTRRGGFFAMHNHPMASWSGVYCVDPGKHDPDKPDSGLLSFFNPAVAGAMYLDVSTANVRGPYSHNINNVRMEPGQLLIFPSWVLHDVKPYEGEGERITVAFNTWFGVKDEAPQGSG